MSAPWTSLHLSRQKLTSCRKVCRRFLILPLSSAAKPISWMLFILMILPFPALLPQHLQLRSRVLPHRKNPTDTSAASDSSEASGSKDSSSSTQEEGTLSPSSGSTFTDNSDSSMDNLLNQVQSLLPTDNGTWSVYVCNLAKNTEGPSMISRCRLPA